MPSASTGSLPAHDDRKTEEPPTAALRLCEVGRIFGCNGRQLHGVRPEIDAEAAPLSNAVMRQTRNRGHRDGSD